MLKEDQRHIIERQIIELTTSNQGIARNLQNSASQLLQNNVLPAIEKICHKFSTPDNVIQIDQLELDLGAFPFLEFETQFCERTIEQFEKKLEENITELIYRSTKNTQDKFKPVPEKKKKPENQIIHRIDKQLELLTFFLETGQLPWYQQNSDGFSISGVFLFLEGKNPNKLFSLLKKLFENQNILKRFIYQFNDEIKQKTFDALYLAPKKGNSINSTFVNDIAKAWKPKINSPMSQDKYRFLVWLTAFNELVIRKNSLASFSVNLVFILLQEIVRSESSVDPVTMFLIYFRQTIFESKALQNSFIPDGLINITDTFIFYIIYKLSDEPDLEKNLKVEQQYLKINGKKPHDRFSFNKSINEQLILEIKKLLENTSFASIERLKTEILSRGNRETGDSILKKENQGTTNDDNAKKKIDFLSETGQEIQEKQKEKDKQGKQNRQEKQEQRNRKEVHGQPLAQKQQETQDRQKIQKNQEERQIHKRSERQGIEEPINFSTDNTEQKKPEKHQPGNFPIDSKEPKKLEEHHPGDREEDRQRIIRRNIQNRPYEFRKAATIEQIYIENAGLALVWPYLPALFKELKLLTDNQQFKDFESQLIAIAATHYLIYGTDENIQEYELCFNKLICGLEIDTPVPILENIPDPVKVCCDEMLTEAVQNWKALKNSTIYGLRATFLQREGMLSKAANGWKLYLERSAFDVLLDRLPWSIAVAVLPWCKNIIYVEW
jgi:hypothetical protein